MYTSKEILFEVTEDALFVANGGHPFSRKDVISILCLLSQREAIRQHRR